jgi:hypothetical protein
MERIERRCRQISDLVVQSHSIENAEQGRVVLAGFDEVLATFDQFQAALNRAMAPATVGQIVEAMKDLRNSYPPRRDLESVEAAVNMATYTKNLRNDIASLEPSPLALHIACARLRRTVKWPDPAIAEAYEAVKTAQADMVSVRDFYMPRLVKFRDQVAARVAEL